MTFRYFGYGSNMALSALLAKGVTPLTSEAAVLRGWRLRFNVEHFFRHEGGMANIEPAEPESAVLGVLHLCADEHLALLDAAEVYPHGYDRMAATVATRHGDQEATTYVGTPEFLNDSCLPTPRYINILAGGAAAAGLDPNYVETLRRHPVLRNPPSPPYEPPRGDFPTFTAATLAERPLCTALAGAVFDMAGARPRHHLLRPLLGGRDMTLRFLMRLDTSDGGETLDDVRAMRFNDAQKVYVNEYLHAFASEYAYAGRFRYD